MGHLSLSLSTYTADYPIVHKLHKPHRHASVPIIPKLLVALPTKPQTFVAIPGKGASMGKPGRLGSYMLGSEYDAARAAFLADWQQGGSADTFTAWVAAALDAYASLSPAQRSERRTERAFGTARSESGASTRSLDVDTAVVDRVRSAIIADNQAGDWPTESAWVADALRAAVEATLTRTQGQLPAPPTRLPGRLRRT